MPPNTVKVTRPGKWGNPFVVGKHGSAEDCVRRFRNYIRGVDCSALRGKTLACFCALSQPCHADVLLEIANASALPKREAAPSTAAGTE